MASESSGAGRRKPPEGRRFQPGKSGNPGGIPKGKRISTWMLELGALSDEELAAVDEKSLPQFGKIALQRIKDAKAAGGDRSTDTILERTEGKVTQGFELGGPGGAPVRFTLGLGDGQAE